MTSEDLNCVDYRDTSIEFAAWRVVLKVLRENSAKRRRNNGAHAFLNHSWASFGILCLTMRSSSSPLRRGHTERKRSRDCCDFEPDGGTDVLTVAGIVRVSCLGMAVGTDIRDVGRCKWRSGMKSGMRKSGMSGRRAASHAAVGRIMQMRMQRTKTNADTNNNNGHQ